MIAQEPSESSAHRQLTELETIYAHVPIGLCVIDSALRFVRMNERLAEINGLSVAQHIGRTIREVLPELADKLEPLVQSVLESGIPVLQREIRGTTPAQPGVDRYWLASYHPLKEADAVAAVNVVVIEVTEQKLAQQALQRSEERLRIALEGNSEGVWDWDIRKGPAVFSAGYSRMLGYEPEEFAKDYDTWRALVHPDDIGRVDRAHAEHIYENKKFRVELRMRKKNGDWCWILSRGAVVERDSEGHAVRMIGTHTDITELKLAEAERARLQEQLLQSQKLESVGRLAGGIAHDFNNLLTVINGYSDLLLRELAQEDSHREIISEIRTVGLRAASLTRQLLAFSRKQIRHPQPLVVDVTINGLKHMIARLLGEDVHLKMVLDAPDAVVYADPGQFDQILVNLAVNARDAMPDGGTLTIGTRRREREELGPPGTLHSWIEIAVTDTGVGMDDFTQSHLFEPFFTTKETGKGTGLGLSTIHGIIAQSGGRIQVDSSLGAGTTFRIYLQEMEGPATVSKSVEEATNLFGTETILVVEDEAEVRSYTMAALRAYGYQVLIAESARAAMLILEQEKDKINLMLTDVVMPNVSGRDLAGQLAKLQPSLKVLYMSGYTSDIVARHGIVEEGLALLEKPFSPEQLAQKVREVLGPSKSLGRVLVLADGQLHSEVCALLNRAGCEVVEESSEAHPVDLVLAELMMPEEQAIETVRQLRRNMPRAAIIAILEASGGRFLELERLLAANSTITKPISPDFFFRTVREVLSKGKTSLSFGMR